MREPARFVKPLLELAALLGAYTAISLTFGSGRPLAPLAGAVLCVVPLAANLGFLRNAGSPYRRQNAYWTLWAAGCGVWSLGELLGTIGRLSANPPALAEAADFAFFLSILPMIAAVAMRPHRRQMRAALRYGYLDLALLTAWGAFLYGFFVLAAGLVSPNSRAYDRNYFTLTLAMNLLLLTPLFLQMREAEGSWKELYRNLCGASALHGLGWLLILHAVARGAYFPGSLYDLPLLASFAWLGYAGWKAHPEAPRVEQTDRPAIDHQWALRLSMVGIVSLPVLGSWAMLEHTDAAVERFRIDLTLGAIIAGTLLLLLRQQRVDAYRRALIRDTQSSLAKANRLQTHLVLTEKLASLGQLAAGAARELSDPLAAIFGYTELLLAEPEASETTRSAARKIHVQAHRTGALVDNLLRFARQVPAEKCLLDLNVLLASAVEPQRLHLADRQVSVELKLEPGLPVIRGNPNLLLQVVYEILNNAADAMAASGGGKLVIRSQLVKGDVVIEFGDSGPGMERPDLVFDPFYTTKPVGKGTGLGLSICYGIVGEHGGQITCRNRPEGGAVFRIELPAVILPLPLRSLLRATARIA